LSRYCFTLQGNHLRLSGKSLWRLKMSCLTCFTEQHIVQISAVKTEKRATETDLHYRKFEANFSVSVGNSPSFPDNKSELFDSDVCCFIQYPRYSPRTTSWIFTPKVRTFPIDTQVWGIGGDNTDVHSARVLGREGRYFDVKMMPWPNTELEFRSFAHGMLLELGDSPSCVSETGSSMHSNSAFVYGGYVR
jgi:hypothetical protein